MLLEFNQDQLDMLQSITDFCKKEIEPITEEYDELQTIPKNVLDGLKSLGLFGLEVPTEYGGLGVDTVTVCAILEEISVYSASVAVMLAVHNSVAVYPIAVFGSDDQKKKYLPKMATGEWIGAFGLTEPHAGSDAASITSSAKWDGSIYKVNGSKIFITNGEICDIVVALLKTDPDEGAKGTSLFILEREKGHFQTGKKEKKMGMRMSDTTEIIFEGAEVSKNHLIGDENSGFKIIMDVLNQSRLGIGAQAIGIARAALDESLKYAKQREQFNRPIAHHQSIQFKLAEMAVNIRNARLGLYDACSRKDKGMEYAMESSMAKLYASKICVDATREAVQIHGGYGYMKDYKVERLYRDAKVTEIYEGTSEVQKIIISKNLLSKN